MLADVEVDVAYGAEVAVVHRQIAYFEHHRLRVVTGWAFSADKAEIAMWGPSIVTSARTVSLPSVHHFCS